MLDTGSNTSLLSKKAAKQLGLSGPQTYLTMNLAGGQKKAEVCEMIDIDIVSPTDEDIVTQFESPVATPRMYHANRLRPSQVNSR